MPKCTNDAHHIPAGEALAANSEVSGRKLRAVVLDCIRGPDLEQALSHLGRRVRPRQLIRPLFSLIKSADDETKYRAVAALGWVTATLAETDIEAARDVVRRLMLSLTEESGGIGWGAPEAIGAILARNERLAEEYTDILISYLHQDGDNYLDHLPLQRGVLWGLEKLARSRPQLLIEKGAIGCLRSHLESSDATVRALAAWTLGILEASSMLSLE